MFFLTFVSFVYPKNFTVQENNKKERKEKKSPDFIIKKEKGKYGVLDEKNKKILIPIIYEKILPVNEDGFAAQKEGKWIIFNIEGKLISSFYAFEKIYIPTPVEGDNKIIIIGKRKKKETRAIVIIKNISGYYYNVYDNIQAISPNYFHITKNNKYGTLTSTGKEIIPPSYESILYLRSSKKGEPYMAKVQNEYSGFINLSTGEAVVLVIWKEVEILTPTLFKVYDTNHKWGIVDAHNKQIIPTQYNHITALSPKFIKVENNAETFFISLDSQTNTPDTQKTILTDSLQIDQKNMKFGVVNNHNSVIIPFEYTNITKTPQPVFIVTKNKKYKLINYSGKEVTPYYNHIEYDPFTQNFLIEDKKGKWMVLNYKGEILLETKFSKKEKLINFLNAKTQIISQKEKRNNSNWLENVGNAASGIGVAFLYVVYALAYIINIVNINYI